MRDDGARAYLLFRDLQSRMSMPRATLVEGGATVSTRPTNAQIVNLGGASRLVKSLI